MKRAARARVLAAAAILAAALPAGAASAAPDPIYVARVDDTINLAVADYVQGAIERTRAEGGQALLIELDTPGGLLSATKDIVSELLNSPVPVIVFVSPRGARAASAGTFITMAAHVAAMAPGTSIGAAHPVFQGQGPTLPPLSPDADEKDDDKRQPRDYVNEKAENFTAAFIESIAEERGRNVEWAIQAVRDSVAIKHSEAVEKNVVDLIADDVDELIEKLDGRTLELGGETIALHTRDARRIQIEMTRLQKFMAFLSIPQVALILLLGAAAGLYTEVQSPGLIVPGALGVICLVLLGLSLQIIPFNWLGLILIVAGLGLLAAELFVTSFGLLFAAGVACFAIGAYMTFRVPEISDLQLPLLGFVAPLTLVFAGFGAVVVYGVSRSFARPQYAGREGLIGEIGVADGDLDPDGRVSVRGELWSATSDTPIARGEPIEVVGLVNLLLRVRRAPESAEKEF